MSILPTIDSQFKSLIPPLLPGEREQLEQNILESRKCYDPIILWEGVIIDGHNRFEICIKHGIEFQIEEMSLSSREEAVAWILDNQLSRRNLNDAARIEIALLKADMLREKAQRNLTHGGRPRKYADEKGLPISSKPTACRGCGLDEPLSVSPKPTACRGCGLEKPLSVSQKPAACRGCGLDEPLSASPKPETDTINVQEAIASEASVSKGKLYSYMQIKEHGSPQLIEQVQNGELKINTAYNLLTKQVLKQLTQIDKLLNFIKLAAPPEGYKTADPEIHKKLQNLSTQYKQLQAILAEGDTNEAA